MTASVPDPGGDCRWGLFNAHGAARAGIRLARAPAGILSAPALQPSAPGGRAIVARRFNAWNPAHAPPVPQPSSPGGRAIVARGLCMGFIQRTRCRSCENPSRTPSGGNPFPHPHSSRPRPKGERLLPGVSTPGTRPMPPRTPAVLARRANDCCRQKADTLSPLPVAPQSVCAIHSAVDGRCTRLMTASVPHRG